MGYYNTDEYTYFFVEDQFILMKGNPPKQMIDSMNQAHGQMNYASLPLVVLPNICREQ